MFKNFISKLKNNKKEQILLSRLLDNINFQKEITSINDLEYSVFSQWGDDGIISYLVEKLDLKNKKFLEFGVEDYTECNTRLLLEKNNMSGLIIECDKKNFEKINKSDLIWKYDISVKNEFITKNNINEIIQDYEPSGLGLLSIDIDGNDFWIWKVIKNINQPDVVVIEFNSIFGKQVEASTIYNDHFDRTKTHYSNLLYGASISSLIKLGEEKGYMFLGTNLNGNNAYFVLNKYKNIFENIKPVINLSKFKESRDKSGRLTLLNRQEASMLLNDEEVFNFKSNSTCKLKDL